MNGKSGCITSVLTNVFLAALILTLYYATQPGAAALPASAPVYRGTGDRAALQFAVSWNADALSDIMDTLKEEGVRATFAVSGSWAEDNPELLRRMAAEGHEIGSMGYHPNMDGRLSWTVRDVKRAGQTISKICGTWPELYYSGTRGVAVSSAAARRLGLTHVVCTIDLLCARGDASGIISRIPDQPIGGSIILLYPTAACAEALPGIIAALNEKGLSACATGDVLG